MAFFIINLKVKKNESFFFLKNSLLYKIVQTKSWFEQEPEPALPNYDDEVYKEMSKNKFFIFHINQKKKFFKT